VKNFIAAVLLFAVLQAHAEVIAVSSTKAGGEIRLTNQQSNCPSDARWFYTTTREGEVLPGCWSMVDGDVFASYRDGSIRLYSLDAFILKKPATPAKQRGQSL
jgi:hypothetical protein